MLNASEGKGEIIVISDGDLRGYPDVFLHSSELIREINVTLVSSRSRPSLTGTEFSGILRPSQGRKFLPFTYPPR